MHYLAVFNGIIYETYFPMHYPKDNITLNLIMIMILLHYLILHL